MFRIGSSSRANAASKINKLRKKGRKKVKAKKRERLNLRSLSKANIRKNLPQRFKKLSAEELRR